MRTANNGGCAFPGKPLHEMARENTEEFLYISRPLRWLSDNFKPIAGGKASTQENGVVGQLMNQQKMSCVLIVPIRRSCLSQDNQTESVEVLS